MGSPLTHRREARFIGIVERLPQSWKASFRLHRPDEVFAQPGETEIFASEIDAVKWLHREAAARGFNSIEIERKNRSEDF